MASTNSNKKTNHRTVKNIGIVISALVSFFLILWVATYYKQTHYFSKAMIASKESKTLLSISLYESTIRMYTPFSQKVKHSVDQLWLIAQDYEEKGQLEEALLTYRSLKSSLYAIRSFYEPYIEKRKLAEEHERKIVKALKNAKEAGP